MTADTDSPRSPMRVIGLLEALTTAEDGLALAELSQRLETPKSSLLLLLRPLVTSGYLLRAAGRYRLGSTAYRLAAGILAARRYPAELRAALEWLGEQSGETVFLTALDRDAGVVTYIEMIESKQEVRYVPNAGATRPLYTSAAGRALLAHQDPAWVEAYLQRTELRRITARSVTSRPRLREILAEVRAQGVCVTDGETVEGAAGCAAPIFAADGTVDMAILIGAPADRFKREAPRMIRLVKEAARRASAADAPATPPAPAKARRAAALTAGSPREIPASASRGTPPAPRAPRAR